MPDPIILVISEEVRSLVAGKLGRHMVTNVSLSGVSLGAAHRVHTYHLAPGPRFEVGKLQI